MQKFKFSKFNLAVSQASVKRQEGEQEVKITELEDDEGRKEAKVEGETEEMLSKRLNCICKFNITFKTFSQRLPFTHRSVIARTISVTEH